MYIKKLKITAMKQMDLFASCYPSIYMDQIYYDYFQQIIDQLLSELCLQMS